MFKAKKLSNDKWVKGSLVKTPFGTFIEWYEDSICNKREVNPDTVCQSTRLIDSNDIEVWEGDVIKDPYLNKKCTIEWNHHLCCFNALDEINSFQHPLGALVESLGWYVVGNKFDNM